MVILQKTSIQPSVKCCNGMKYLCMLGLRGAICSCPGGGRWPQKSGKARTLNPGIDLVLVAVARYNLGSWWGMQGPCFSNNLSIMVEWWDSSAPSSSLSCSYSLWPGGPSLSLSAENKKFKVRNHISMVALNDKAHTKLNAQTLANTCSKSRYATNTKAHETWIVTLKVLWNSSGSLIYSDAWKFVNTLEYPPEMWSDFHASPKNR